MSMILRRKAAIWIAGAGSVFLCMQPARTQQPEVAYKATIDRYCVSCHSEKLKTGSLVLEKADLNKVAENPELWEKVIRKLRAGAMPPVGMPKPDAVASSNLATYLETTLDRVALAKPNPGHATLHRLNRAEYRNSVRDLLALDVDPATLLPPDDESYGFDNNADVLGISPALLEQYMSASRKVSRLAVGDTSITPVAQTYRTRPDLSQDNHVDGLPLGTRGGLAAKHLFPLDAEYRFRILLARNTVDVTRGLEEVHEIEITVDGERVFSAKIGGKEDTDRVTANPADEMANLDKRLSVQVPITAGPHMIGATFVKRNSAEPDHILQPFLRTTLDPVNEAGLPHIENMVVAGPYNVKGSGDTPSRRKIFSCRPKSEADEVPCAKTILTALAKQAYRRPATDRDMETLLGFYQSGRNNATFDDGIERAIRFVLADPQFLFRFEHDPANLADGSVYRVGGIELASRLSYFLWSSVPDDELLAAAVAGKLSDPATLDKQVRRMLADRKADALVSNFSGQWLFLRNLKNIVPDPQQYPDFDDNLRAALGKETEMFFGSIVREDHNVLDLLNADYTFLNERLARHYGVPNVYGERFRKVQITDDNRRGLLGQGSILTVTSHATRTSPVLRGKYILTNFLGTPPPPPPPDVPALKENGEAGVKLSSVRERMEAHRANPTCASCHKLMDPLGFALENYDAIGKWRSQDSGQPIDSAGQLLDGSSVNGPASLRKALLARKDVFVGTLTEKLMTYALGRGLDAYDMPYVREVVRGASKDDYKFSRIVLGIANSVPFQYKVKSNEALLKADAR